MQKRYIVLFIVLVVITEVRAQYVNTDSLKVVAGFENPLLIQTFDSLYYILPETAIFQGNEIIQDRHIPAGRLLEQFGLPATGKVISRFGPHNGRMHSGTDIKMNKGDTIYAVYRGTVTRARYYYGYGNLVVIGHNNSLETSYAHLSEFLTKTGETVEKGEPVGLAGRTGRASTDHLHFEIRESGRAFDPELIFDFENTKVRDEVKGTYNLTELNQLLKPVGYSVNEPTPATYTVQNGDSLWIISRRFKTSIPALCQLNNLTENSVLRVGMKLKLY
jgi:murein DD-endopeptidase MepM/ murein hydrolase activator NlpD